ncbi:hypothetical protein [Microbacterium sp. SSM24]|uniref:hypothetical protein n=1 Tax=Microbacterium sp. SSM24 TaxID=2991714 RepID=UPI002227F2E9|nr:hypothetical protein [Microbacterium sp. SSM24]MCW3492430.1 hypothetical protein [Microbacterium sp. SSM24]
MQKPKSAAISVLLIAGLLAAGSDTASAMGGPAMASVTDSEEDSQVVEESITIGPVAPGETTAPNGKVTPNGKAATAAICVAVNRVDYPHISSTSSYLAVQAHGNWDKGTCKATLADVTTQIDRKNPIGLFQAVGTQGKGRLAPNPKGLTSGGAGRVTAHYRCNGKAAAPFRAWTKIDMVGIADTQNATTTPATSPIKCG